MWTKTRAELLSRLRGLEGLVRMLSEDTDGLVTALERIEVAARNLVNGFDRDPDSVCWPDGRPLVDELRAELAALAPLPPRAHPAEKV